MSKVQIFSQDFEKCEYGKRFTANWDLVRNPTLTFETELSGEAAAEEAYVLTNAPLECLVEKHTKILKESGFHGPSLSVGDIVAVTDDKGVTTEYLCASFGWEKREK